MGFSHAESAYYLSNPARALTRFIQKGGVVQVLPPEHELIRRGENTADGRRVYHCYGQALQVPASIRRRQMAEKAAAEAANQPGRHPTQVGTAVTDRPRRRPAVTKASILPAKRELSRAISAQASESLASGIGNPQAHVQTECEEQKEIVTKRKRKSPPSDPA